MHFSLFVVARKLPKKNYHVTVSILKVYVCTKIVIYVTGLGSGFLLVESSRFQDKTWADPGSLKRHSNTTFSHVMDNIFIKTDAMNTIFNCIVFFFNKSWI